MFAHSDSSWELETSNWSECFYWTITSWAVPLTGSRLISTCETTKQTWHTLLLLFLGLLRTGRSSSMFPNRWKPKFPFSGWQSDTSCGNTSGVSLIHTHTQTHTDLILPSWWPPAGRPRRSHTGWKTKRAAGGRVVEKDGQTLNTSGSLECRAATEPWWSSARNTLTHMQVFRSSAFTVRRHCAVSGKNAKTALWCIV